jgi:NAD(P)H-dependent FMN reductase
MADLKIAVIVGSTRPGRKGRTVADWVIDQAKGRDASYEIVDLVDYPLPIFDEANHPALGQYEQEHTKAWSKAIASYDGYIFVTPEYNHSTSAALKNALDYLQREWHNKAAALVGYGAVGGTRAVEHLRAVLSVLQIAHVGQALAFSLFTDFENFTTFKPAESQAAYAKTLFDQLEAWAAALKPLRG